MATVVSVAPVQSAENGFIWLAGSTRGSSFVTGSQGFNISNVLFPIAETGFAPGTATFPVPSDATQEVIWITAPGTYSIQATIAWTSGPVSESTDVGNSADTVPHVLQTMLTTSTGYHAGSGSGPVFTNTLNTVVGSVASMEAITPYIMPPRHGAGSAPARHIDNFVTQDVATRVVVEPGAFVAFRLQALASKFFPRPVTPLLYSLTVLKTDAPTPAAYQSRIRGGGGSAGAGAPAAAPDNGPNTAAMVGLTTLFTVLLLFSAVSSVLLLVKQYGKQRR